MMSSPPCANKDILILEASNYELKDKNDTFSINIEIKDNLIVFNINKKNSNFPILYFNEFNLSNLQKKAKIFKLFDNIKEAFEEIKQRFKENNCTLNCFQEKIIISFKTNVVNSDYSLDFMQKKLNSEAMIHKLQKNIDDLTKKNKNLEERVKALENNKKEQEKLKFEKENQSHFKESIILKNKEEKD